MPVKFCPNHFSLFSGIRLAGASRPNEGRVEIFSHGSWGTICVDTFDMIDADVICKELGYAKASTKKVKINKTADPSMKIHINYLDCHPGDYFWHCSHYNFNQKLCDHTRDISVSCISGTHYYNFDYNHFPTIQDWFSLENSH